MGVEILGEQVIQKQGSFRQIRRYVKGWHPEEGRLTYGLQGKETIIDKTSIRPLITFDVKRP